MDTVVLKNSFLLKDDDLQIKKNKLLSFAYSILRSPVYKDEFDRLILELNLTEEGVLDAFLAYNLDIYTPEGNKIYESLANRVVLYIHNLIKGSWHIERQQTIVDMLKATKTSSVADIGFGIPSQYVKEFILKGKVRLALCDLYEAAFTFAKGLLKIWNKDWQNIIEFKKCNMDSQDFVGVYDTYLFIDSIEHTLEPATFLEKYVQLSPTHAHFLISLPIGPIIPRHTIAWQTDKEAEDWLSACGLDILLKRNVYVQPEVDLYQKPELSYQRSPVSCA